MRGVTRYPAVRAAIAALALAVSPVTSGHAQQVVYYDGKASSSSPDMVTTHLLAKVEGVRLTLVFNHKDCDVTRTSYDIASDGRFGFGDMWVPFLRWPTRGCDSRIVVARGRVSQDAVDVELVDDASPPKVVYARVRLNRRRDM